MECNKDAITDDMLDVHNVALIKRLKMYYQKGRYNIREIGWLLHDGKITDKEYCYIVGEN